ncbi:phage major capsid protein [Bacillus salipaludis]|uniref:Phage major capsid protein n=1 Tax=Bacillus salipaludis TaxID=2547811 RepID=A0A4R5VLG0_9BACI|nr:phage major capsid protein [Bacillus salipaludis]MDQ6599231.1 phage major capsid protein [Bacillus salipaludis]TDK58875.1 phage major capsid protein [Bacillus salipaludis]
MSKALIEERNALLDLMDNLVEKIKVDKRGFNVSEKHEIDMAKARIGEIDMTLDLEKERRGGMENMQVIKNVDVENEKEQRALDEKAFLTWVKENRATGGITAGSNGGVIPVSIASQIIDQVKNMSGILQRATVWNVQSDLNIPVYDFTQHVVSYFTEGSSIADSNATFTTVALKNVIIGTLTKVSNSFINRSDINVVPFLINELAKAISWFLEGELIAGVGGAGKLNGLAQITAGQTTTGATTMTITPDELISLQLKVPQVYQENACWLMSPSTFAYIRSLKATTGQSLFTDGGLSNKYDYLLLGKPVLLSDRVPNMAVNALEIFYGDFSGLHVKMTNNMEIKVLLERYAEMYQTGISAFIEMDSALAEPAKIVCYKGK